MGAGNETGTGTGNETGTGTGIGTRFGLRLEGKLEFRLRPDQGWTAIYDFFWSLKYAGLQHN